MKTLKNYTETYKHQIITTETTETFFDKATDVDLKPVFDQYLRDSKLPVLQFKKVGTQVYYRWQAVSEDFKMPVDIFVKGKEMRVYPTNKWKPLPEMVQDKNEVEVNDQKFYITSSFMS